MLIDSLKKERNDLQTDVVAITHDLQVAETERNEVRKKVLDFALERFDFTVAVNLHDDNVGVNEALAAIESKVTTLDHAIDEATDTVEEYERGLRKIHTLLAKVGVQCGPSTEDIIKILESMAQNLYHVAPTKPEGKRSRFRTAVVAALGELLR